MQIPLEITFRNMEPSEIMESRVREKAAKLERYGDSVIGCRVTVDAPHRHHRKGNLYHVRIDVTVPDGELVVSRESPRDHAHEDAYVAIRDAFNAVGRQLEEYNRRQQGQIKSHPLPPHGQVKQLFPLEGYGIIESADGRDIYFHKNSLINDVFEQLEVGVDVRFAEERGEQGPQASSVYVEGKHHITGAPPHVTH